MWSCSQEYDPLSILPGGGSSGEYEAAYLGQCGESIFHVDTFGNDKVQIGCLAIDTAATRTIMQTKTNLLLTGKRRSNASMRAFAGSATRMADIDGTAHFCIVDPTDSTILQPLSIDATTIKQANANLLSGEDMIRKLGFSLILDPGTVTGFYKFEKPLSISHGTLSQNRIVQEIPATYDPERRMWLVHFVMARSRTDAIEAAHLRLGSHARHE